MSDLGCPNCDGPCIPTCIDSRRTVQDLLGERQHLAIEVRHTIQNILDEDRLLVIEVNHERDKTVCAAILSRIGEIDSELGILRRDAAGGAQ